MACRQPARFGPRLRGPPLSGPRHKPLEIVLQGGCAPRSASGRGLRRLPNLLGSRMDRGKPGRDHVLRAGQTRLTEAGATRKVRCWDASSIPARAPYPGGRAAVLLRGRGAAPRRPRPLLGGGAHSRRGWVALSRRCSNLVRAACGGPPARSRFRSREPGCRVTLPPGARGRRAARWGGRGHQTRPSAWWARRKAVK